MNYKDITYYLDLPWTYSVEIGQDEKGEKIYIVSVNELPGVSTDAHNLDEAMELIQDAMEGAFRLYMKHGEEIPEPIDPERYKGNISYRTSGNRHFLIAREAARQNKSLSQLLDQCVDDALDRRNR